VTVEDIEPKEILQKVESKITTQKMPSDKAKDTIFITTCSTGAVACYILICVLYHLGYFTEEN